MKYKESVTIELKKILTDDIKKEIVAFANSDGGSIYIGIEDDGKVYVRHGTSSVPATDTAIRKMIKDTDGESYEDIRSINQSLTFIHASNEFKKRGVEFGLSNMMTLKLCSNEGIYTNLGLLLSDQCCHSIKIAIFQDDSMKIFKDRREFTGSLFKQIEDAYDFIDVNNPIRSSFNKLLRIDIRNFPEVAVREALLNAIVHRDYALSASTLIKIFPDKIEFISVGSLLNGIELEDILSGFSICRNPNLAAIFYRLQLIEAYGTGMQKIFEAYAGSEKEPKIDTTPNVFKITLPSINLSSNNLEDLSKYSTAEEKIMKKLKFEESITRKETQEILKISQTPAGNLLKEMTAKGIIKRKGKGKNVRYYLP